MLISAFIVEATLLYMQVVLARLRRLPPGNAFPVLFQNRLALLVKGHLLHQGNRSLGDVIFYNFSIICKPDGIALLIACLGATYFEERAEVLCALRLLEPSLVVQLCQHVL